MIYPVILSGGTGSRLWPLSRKALPKQFLPLTSEYSLLQETVLRLRDWNVVHDAVMQGPVMVCNQEHRFLTAEQLREIDVTPQILMLEPVGRNTAPAIAVAALYLAQQNPEAILLVLPSDHVINDREAFLKGVAQATAVARQNYLVTFGIVPTRPETGYGYIERGEALPEIPGIEDAALENRSPDEELPVGEERYPKAYRLSRFVEKPELSTAQEYVASQRYYWNSGMFVFPVQLFLDELERFHPEILVSCREALKEAHADLDFYRLEEAAFGSCPSLSIDHAVMERTECGVVIPIDIGWNDVGSWAALWEHQAKSDDGQTKGDDGNVTRGEIFLHNSRNCYINAEKRLIAAVGVEDLIIVETADAILVTNHDHSQDVKKVVDWLEQENREEHSVHQRVYRPWGSYEGIERGERFQVKRLIVKPGEQSSMQMHHHRSEHWVVVSGTAEVTLGDEVRLVAENESIYIPLGVPHRIHNPGRIPLHFIEVQSGAYLGEDDIVRSDDKYGR